MSPFIDYLQPFTAWLHAHPQWAILMTFLVSFSESLAIIGSIVPGSVTMTAVGILAGRGVMRIDLTFLAATLGAIAGDSSSYALGYVFRDRLENIWPFKKHPRWLAAGRDYFEQHGASSVLIGRFIGPMRSIIPVIAGMMHMNQWRFLLVNVLSALAWSMLYVAPGVFIGMASNELSMENTPRLFMVILSVFLTLWLLTLGIKWLITTLYPLLCSKLHNLSVKLKKHPYWSMCIKKIIPRYEINHYRTAGLSFLLILSTLVSLIIAFWVIQNTWIAHPDYAIFNFFQTLRTPSLDIFFVIISLSMHPIPIFTLLTALTITTVYERDGYTFGYCLSLLIIGGLFLGLWRENHPILPFFSIANLSFATVLFTFLTNYIKKYYRNYWMLSLRIVLSSLLFLDIFSLIYLGDGSVSRVLLCYFTGLTVGLTYWLLYRRKRAYRPRPVWPILLSLGLFILSTAITYGLYFKKSNRTHHYHVAEYVITDNAWWNQKQPLLPLYSTNRIGQPTSLLNIQYIGSIQLLQKALLTAGWKKRSHSFFYSLLIRAGGGNSAKAIPLMAELYQNKKPYLIMTHPDHFILRLWQSNYHLRHHKQAIWLGSIEQYQRIKSKKLSFMTPFDAVIDALPGFDFHLIPFNPQALRSLPMPPSATLLMIKDPSEPTNVRAIISF